MDQLITWKARDWNRTIGWVGDVHAATLEWSTAGYWKVRPNFPAPAAPLSKKHTTLESAKQAAEDWWRSTLTKLGAVPKVPEPEDLTGLVEKIRRAVLESEDRDSEVHRARIDRALVYMEGVFSPSQITLKHITRILKGE